MGDPIPIVFICMGKFIRIQRVKDFGAEVSCKIMYSYMVLKNFPYVEMGIGVAPITQ